MLGAKRGGTNGAAFCGVLCPEPRQNRPRRKNGTGSSVVEVLQSARARCSASTSSVRFDRLRPRRWRDSVVAQTGTSSERHARNGVVASNRVRRREGRKGVRRISIPELLRYVGRPGFKRGFAAARTFVGRRVVVAVAAVALLALPPGATGDAPLVSLSVYGTLGQNGWYVSNVTLNWSFSGPVHSSTGCSNTTLTADTPGTTFTCTATSLDRSTTMSLSKTIKLDKTPPTLSKLAVRAGTRRLDLSWVASSDTQLVQVLRKSNARGGKSGLVYSGTRASFRDTRVQIGTRYRYTVTAIDQAGNRAAKTLTVSVRTLFAPMPSERVSRAPVLRWTPVKGAQYYNVQLVRGKKILSAWPATTHFQVPRSWVYHGHRYRLHRGAYRWYVWPGIGSRSANRYGRMLGGNSFVFSPA